MRQHVQSSPPPRKTFARARLVPRMANEPRRRSARPIASAAPASASPHPACATGAFAPLARRLDGRSRATSPLLIITLTPPSPACASAMDLVRASRTRMRKSLRAGVERGPARGVRPGLRAVARADGRHASGSGGAGQRGRRRHRPAGVLVSLKKKRTDPRADTAAFRGKALAPLCAARQRCLRRNLRTLGRGSEAFEGWCDSCRAYTRHNKSASPREEGHRPSPREAFSKVRRAEERLCQGASSTSPRPAARGRDADRGGRLAGRYLRAREGCRCAGGAGSWLRAEIGSDAVDAAVERR